VDLQMLLKSLGSWVRRVLTPRINLEVECSTPLLINVDRAQLENALLNLAINARDAMPDGGNLTLKAERVADTRATHCDTQSIADDVELSVRDTGTGMSEDVIARAFEPFFTTKELGNGSGLGLSMVQGFVQQSGGSVSIDSAAGRGTTFCLRFPGFAGTSTTPPALATHGAAPNTKAAPPARILVVEDEDGVRRIAVNMLTSLGYTVHAVSTAEEALAFIGNETTAPCELVFSDVLLAGGMDGAELGIRLAETHPFLPVLLTSGHPRESLARHRGPNQLGLLMKPYDRSELRSAIEQAIAAAA
jgi:CheY-like chemotaxis protein